MAPWGMRSSLPFPEGFLLLVVRYSLVPGGKLARFAKLLAGSCSVAMTKEGEKKQNSSQSFQMLLEMRICLTSDLRSCHLSPRLP